MALFKQSYPALAVRKLSLWVASPGDWSQPPFYDRSLGRRPVSGKVSSEVAKVPLAELRRLFVTESKSLSMCMERKDGKKKVKCRER